MAYLKPMEFGATASIARSSLPPKPASWIHLYGQFLYSRPENDTTYQQFNTGNFAPSSQLDSSLASSSSCPLLRVRLISREMRARSCGFFAAFEGAYGLADRSHTDQRPQYTAKLDDQFGAAK